MRFSTILASVFLTIASAIVAQASDKKFFRDIQGKWSGPGEIVAGKYKGTKFVCTFDGDNPVEKAGMEVDGSCRVGVFAQPMNALILKAGGSYVGRFLDGEKGKGMDVTGGRYTKGRIVADIKRNDLRGIMVANLSNPNSLRVTISVKHEGRLVPVIGMNLARKTDNVVTGSIND